MKKIIFIALLITIISNAIAQKNQNGIYKSANDFKNKNLIFSDSKKIKSDLILKSSFVKIRTNNQSQYIKKDSVWGISQKGKIFRFYNSKNYELVSSDNIYIYTTFVNAKQKKDRIKYYFSKNENSNIYELTVNNIDLVFSENPKFRNYIHSFILEDNELYDFDKNCKTYRITNIYNLCVNN